MNGVSNKDMKTIYDTSFKGKRVLVRVDFNVPLNQNGQISDDTRIKESLCTINKILDDGGSCVLMSHLGRPKGAYEPGYSLTPIVPRLSKLLGRNVIFNRNLFGPDTKKTCDQLAPGDIALLENLRFYKEEEEGNEEFARKLSELGDAYVNDAFATSHRAHTSVSYLPKYFPNDKYSGCLLSKELENIEYVLYHAHSPFTSVIGGAKVSSKLPLIKNLIPKCDNMIIGGGMAFTFIKAMGGKVGDSIVEEQYIQEAKDIVKEMMLKGCNLILPTDAVVADGFSSQSNTKTCAADNIEDGWMGLDIGKKSRQRFAEIINNSNTILWNGPMGVFEMDNFKQGTKALAINVASATICGAKSLVGGGDSVAAINAYKLRDQMSFVSTGGGAMLELIEGKKLPGVEALKVHK